MKQEHAREVYVHLYAYARYREQILAWQDSVIHNTKRMDEEYIKGSGYHSDPTARGALRLAEPPARIVRAQAWVDVIDTAHEELMIEDRAYRKQKNRGVSYVMETYFCFHSDPRNKEDNRQQIQTLTNVCRVSERTIYKWLHKTAVTVERIAKERGLFDGTGTATVGIQQKL